VNVTRPKLCDVSRWSWGIAYCQPVRKFGINKDARMGACMGDESIDRYVEGLAGGCVD